MHTKLCVVRRDGRKSRTARRRFWWVCSGLSRRCVRGGGCDRLCPMYYVAIVGLGCAGYTAAIYCARYKLSTLIIGAEEGGMGMAAAEVGDWPGTVNITGPDLMENFKKHALSFEGVTHRLARVDRIEKGTEGAEVFRIVLQSVEVIEARTVVFALGTKKRHLGVQGEEEFAGKGVTYCATGDAY